MTPFYVGALVTWLFTPRGGYGYTYPVNAEITKVGKKRIQIRAQRASGEYALRWVSQDNLRERSHG